MKLHSHYLKRNFDISSKPSFFYGFCQTRVIYDRLNSDFAFSGPSGIKHLIKKVQKEKVTLENNA